MAETQAPRTQRTRHARRIGLLVGCAALMVVVGAAAVTYGSADPYGAYVDFVPSVSYAAALRTITSLGLQTALPGGCFEGFTSSVAASLPQHVLWVPSGWQNMPWGHRLWVVSTPVAAPSWLDRLRLASGIAAVESGADLTFNCPDDPFVTSPDQAGFLNADEAGTYVRLAFAAPLVSYDDALATIDNLGLRLADPCYEGGVAHAIPWLWHPMDQSASFAARHVLVVATTLYASTTWHDQLQGIHGVAMVQAPDATSCA